MRLYIAGPMSGFVDFNFPVFHRAAAVLADMGPIPVNPAAKESYGDGSINWNLIPKEFSCATGSGKSGTAVPKDIHKQDVGLILSCDGIVMLPGWQHSEGARLEMALAKWCGIKVYRFNVGDLEELEIFWEVETFASEV